LISFIALVAPAVRATDVPKGFTSGTSYTNDPLSTLLGSMSHYLESFKEFEDSYDSLPDQKKQEYFRRLTLAGEANIQFSRDFLKWLTDLPSLSSKQSSAAVSFGKAIQQANFVEAQESILTKQKTQPTLQSLKEVAKLYEKVLPSPASIQEYKSELIDQQKKVQQR